MVLLKGNGGRQFMKKPKNMDWTLTQYQDL